MVAAFACSFCFLTFNYNYFGVIHACEGQRATYRKESMRGTHHVGLGDPTQVLRLASRCLYLPRHLTDLVCLMWALTRQVALAELELNCVDQAALKFVIILLPLEC